METMLDYPSLRRVSKTTVSVVVTIWRALRDVDSNREEQSPWCAIEETPDSLKIEDCNMFFGSRTSASNKETRFTVYSFCCSFRIVIHFLIHWSSVMLWLPSSALSVVVVVVVAVGVARCTDIVIAILITIIRRLCLYDRRCFHTCF